jgi:hypothetical protein
MRTLGLHSGKILFGDDDEPVPAWVRRFVSTFSEGPAVDESSKRKAGRAAAHAISNLAASEASPDMGSSRSGRVRRHSYI